MKKSERQKERDFRKSVKDLRRLRKNKRSTRAGEYGFGRTEDRNNSGEI